MNRNLNWNFNWNLTLTWLCELSDSVRGRGGGVIVAQAIGVTMFGGLEAI